MSGNVHSVFYVAETGRLRVRYRNGGVYLFDGVTDAQFEGLFAPGVSVGRYIHDVIEGERAGVKVGMMDAEPAEGSRAPATAPAAPKAAARKKPLLAPVFMVGGNRGGGDGG